MLGKSICLSKVILEYKKNAAALNLIGKKDKATSLWRVLHSSAFVTIRKKYKDYKFMPSLGSGGSTGTQAVG